jgi:hypothetical protein
VRWVDQWLAAGGYRPFGQESPTLHREVAHTPDVDEPRNAAP